MEFQIGQTYSGYELLDVLKRSKNGIEYRVRNTRAGRLEALRALSENAQGDQERSERFLREMRVHASLLHPNILTMFSAMELENHLVMTTELMEGPSLADRLRLGPLPQAEAIAIIRQVLSALAYAHGEGIVHRDISPENIAINPGGVVKLANFELAKGAGSPKLTQIGMMLGNMRYISPEQVKGKAELDARSDIYSAGMVLYEMLCGRPAFVGESQYEIMAAQVTQAPAPPDRLNPEVSRALATVILVALAKDPAARYQTAAEFEQAIVNAIENRAPAESPSVALPMAAPDAVAPLAVPAFLAAGGPALSRNQVTIGVAAGTCLGMLLVALWLFAK